MGSPDIAEAKEEESTEEKEKKKKEEEEKKEKEAAEKNKKEEEAAKKEKEAAEAKIKEEKEAAETKKKDEEAAKKAKEEAEAKAKITKETAGAVEAAIGKTLAELIKEAKGSAKKGEVTPQGPPKGFLSKHLSEGMQKGKGSASSREPSWGAVKRTILAPTIPKGHYLKSKRTIALKGYTASPRTGGGQVRVEFPQHSGHTPRPHREDRDVELLRLGLHQQPPVQRLDALEQLGREMGVWFCEVIARPSQAILDAQDKRGGPGKGKGKMPAVRDAKAEAIGSTLAGQS